MCTPHEPTGEEPAQGMQDADDIDMESVEWETRRRRFHNVLLLSYSRLSYSRLRIYLREV